MQRDEYDLNWALEEADHVNKYLFLWQAPLAVICIVGWLLGGGYLLMVSLKKQTDAKRVQLGRCVLASMLAGGGGLFGAGAFFILITSIGKHAHISLTWLALPVAVIAMLATAYVVLYSMFDLSAGGTLRLAIRPLLGIAAMVVIIGVPTGMISLSIGRGELARNSTAMRLQIVYHAGIKPYQQRHQKLPPNLAVLVEENHIKATDLAHQLSENDVGFFYVPYRVNSDPAKNPTKKIIACSIGHKTSKGRAVLQADGVAYWASKADLDRSLQEPVNKAFAEKLAEAESK